MSTTTFAPTQPLTQAIGEVYQRYLRGEIGVHRYSSLVDELIEQSAGKTTANVH